MRSFTLRCVLAASAVALTLPAGAQEPVAVPAVTAIPIVLTQTVAAGHANPGDPVVARTLQPVLLSGSRMLPAGSILTGHIVASTAFRFDVTPYATQNPSTLSIHFDTLDDRGVAVPVSLALRAIAGPVASREAQIPHGLDEIDWAPTRTLIGGDTTSSLDKTVRAPDGSIVGYNRSQGVYARLLAASSAAGSVTCDATATEQSVGDFSPDACGVYGLNGVSLRSSGAHDGTSTLTSMQRSVRLDAGTTALLETLAR